MQRMGILHESSFVTKLLTLQRSKMSSLMN